VFEAKALLATFAKKHQPCSSDFECCCILGIGRKKIGSSRQQLLKTKEDLGQDLLHENREILPLLIWGW
jgi:hypothetical protein